MTGWPARPDNFPSTPSAVYRFRPFLNSDPPHLAQIWRNQPPQRGLMQPLSASALEECVFSKPYFDREGLIVAEKEGTPVGFLHAGFGPNDEHDSLSTESGTTLLLMLDKEHCIESLADDLLGQGEAYLRSRGAKVLYAGGVWPLNAFYLGLYGGSELPGVLQSDPVLAQACLRHGYREIDRVHIVQRDLSSFRPPISRQQRQLRREAEVQECANPAPSSWWDACTTGSLESVHYRLVRRGENKTLAEVSFWDIEPLSISWGLRTAGMLRLQVPPEARRQGYATYLLSEAFQRLRKGGMVLIEAQTMQHNEPALALYKKLGFTPVDEGVVFRKE